MWVVRGGEETHPVHLYNFKWRYFADAVKVTESKTAKEDYLRCLFEKAPYAQTVEDWNKLLPWNIEITPFKMRGEWVE